LRDVWFYTVRRRILSLALLAAVIASGAAAAPCKYGRAGELAVTMQGMQPLVHAAINGRDAIFIADSGAFFSILTPAGAREFNLSLQPASPNFALMGVGGNAQAWVTTVPTFTIFNMDLRKVPFLVAGNDLGHGAIGLLGQNVLGIGDVEYDLANGVIRILRQRGDCRKASLAYWANDQSLPYSVIDIDFARAENPRTTGEAYLNGSRIRVEFDSGGGASMVTLEAARRAGVTPDSPGVIAGGALVGGGRRTVRTWIAPFASFKIGDEEIRNTHLRIGDMSWLGADMLIGEDFFLSHRILAANGQGKLYFTYNGGPVFNLTTMPVEPGAPAAATQPAQDQPLDAAGYARRGTASTSRREFASALADLTKAIELDRTQADYFYERGAAYAANDQADKALGDFSQAIRLKPDDVPALMARAELHARRNDPAETISPDLDAVDRAAPREGDVRVALGNLYQRVRNYPAAVVQYGDWINSHKRDDIQMPDARNARCRARALAGQELNEALEDCNFAVHASPKTAAYLDSRGLVYLRQGRYDKALADYNAALALAARSPWSLYGRGLARQHLGQAAAGAADIAAAKAIFPKIAEEAASCGIGP
jgi:tetratricopeptide (TPR) repeat protein